jgi:metallo-beta-lactamase family protein
MERRMKLTVYGAAGEVTGSCYLVRTPRARVLVDLGLHQGGTGAERRNRRLPPIEPDSLDAVVLTHAHLDHSGRLPLLPGAGYDGRVFATPATRDLCEILLRDAAKIQEGDAERASRRRMRQGKPPVRPLFTTEDVEKVLGRFELIGYEDPTEVAPGVVCRFFDAGHILGSASVELTVQDGKRSRTVVFSGDIGPDGAPLMHDPTPPPESAELVVLESTYGDRDHRPMDATLDELVEVLASARRAGGKVLIPSFAVGRTQQLIYHFGQLQRAGRLRGLEVYIDSPMAIETTELYRRHRGLFDEQAWKIFSSGDSPLRFQGLRYVRSVEESSALNKRDGIIVISAAGMCTGGRILHHLKHNLWKESTHVIFVGFQAWGTLGRRLVDGAQRVTVLGEPIAVKAKVHTLGGFSAHAGRSGLVRWAGPLRKNRPKILLTHGEHRPREALRAALGEELGLEAEAPARGESFELA